MSKLRVVFRADASLTIGSGHIMRCLTLADALVARGAECTFICREHPGHLVEHIRARGHGVRALANRKESSGENAHSNYAAWLGTSQEEDARACVQWIKGLNPHWVVVDHYAMNSEWHRIIRPYTKALMAIDDLCDREYDVDLLLDQNLGRTESDYLDLVTLDCNVLAGTRYALLRPEFAEWRRGYSESPGRMVKKVLITMGGMDPYNATGASLKALSSLETPRDFRITVVMGENAQWLEQVRAQAVTLPWSVEVRTGVRNMAELMANHDLAIGAAGSTSWERCCMGLPTVMVVLADNQSYIAEGLAAAGAAVIARLDSTDEERHSIRSQVQTLLEHPETLEKIRRRAADLVDGEGTDRVVHEMLRVLS